MDRPFEEYQGSTLWTELSEGLAHLAARGELEFRATPEHVVGHLAECLAGTSPQASMRDWESEEPYYCYSATLRIFGDRVPFEEIENRLALLPTSSHRVGERPVPTSTVVFKQDMWSYRAPLAEEEALDRHIAALHAVLKPHIAYLKSLRDRWQVDVFCGYRSNSATAGFTVGPKALQLFHELDVPFDVSVVVA